MDDRMNRARKDFGDEVMITAENITKGLMTSNNLDLCSRLALFFRKS